MWAGAWVRTEVSSAGVDRLSAHSHLHLLGVDVRQFSEWPQHLLGTAEVATWRHRRHSARPLLVNLQQQQTIRPPSSVSSCTATANKRSCLLAFFSTVAHVFQKNIVTWAAHPLEEWRQSRRVLFSSGRDSWARRWVNLLTLWRMASAMLDLRLPSQPYGITVILWPIPNYTAWWQKRTCVNNLLVAESKTAGSRTCDLSESNTVTITSAGHPVLVYCPYFPHLL